jgi:uncharacterized protein (TIRG00374 family)
MADGKGDNKAKARNGLILRVGVSVAILGAIFAYLPAGELLSRMASVSPALWVAVFAGFLIGHAASAAKWRWMIGGAISYPRALKAHFAGLAANLALPGVAGGDVVRAGMVMKGSDRKTALAVGSLAERLIDTAALIVVAAAGAAWLGAREGVDPAAVSFAAAATVIVGLVGVAFLKPIAGVIRKLNVKGKAGRLLGDVADALVDMSTRPGAILGCALLSIAVQFSFALMNGALAASLGAGTPLAAWVFAWPLAKLVATLPISFGGIGVREASIAGLMTPLGYAASGVVAASLVWQTIQISAGVLGGLMQGLAGPATKAGISDD